jgi:hypothetical protein
MTRGQREGGKSNRSVFTRENEEELQLRWRSAGDQSRFVENKNPLKEFWDSLRGFK